MQTSLDVNDTGSQTRWCNQVSFVKKKSFYEFCCFDNEVEHKNGAAGECKSLRTGKEFLNQYPDIANQ